MKDTGFPFRLTLSNYTVEVQSDVINKKFVANFQSKRTFAAFAKIKSDVRKKTIPTVTRSELVYFVHDFRQDAHVSRVFNIDMRSAYATILFNDGYISQETYDYLKLCNKQERLASVGMLASKKHHFDFIGHNCLHDEQVISPLAPFFYHAIQKTYKVMSELRRIVGRDYLFTWVDGIYFLPGERKTFFDACAYLAHNGFDYTSAVLTDFKANLLTEKVSVSFYKEGNKKVFNLPFLNNQFKALTLEAILSHSKTQKDEAVQSHFSRKPRK